MKCRASKDLMAKHQFIGKISIVLNIVSISTTLNVKLEKKNSFFKKLKSGTLLLMTC